MLVNVMLVRDLGLKYLSFQDDSEVFPSLRQLPSFTTAAVASIAARKLMKRQLAFSDLPVLSPADVHCCSPPARGIVTALLTRISSEPECVSCGATATAMRAVPVVVGLLPTEYRTTEDDEELNKARAKRLMFALFKLFRSNAQPLSIINQNDTYSLHL